MNIELRDLDVYRQTCVIAKPSVTKFVSWLQIGAVQCSVTKLLPLLQSSPSFLPASCFSILFVCLFGSTLFCRYFIHHTYLTTPMHYRWPLQCTVSVTNCIFVLTVKSFLFFLRFLAYYKKMKKMLLLKR